MYQKIILVFFIILTFSSCSKKEKISNIPSDETQAIAIYKEAMEEMDNYEFYIASKKFSEAESILPNVEWSAKAALMSSYCLYQTGFYDDTILSLNRFIKTYPANENIDYAKYLIIMSLYDQIEDEKNDITPLLKSREKIYVFLKEYPNTEYAIDLKFKLDLINNQLDAKEIYVAKFYIKVKKWIPAINRLKNIVENYDSTVFIEEALHRLVEVYYRVGLIDEAKRAAAILGYNYNSSEWYKQSYKIINKDYKFKEIKKSDQNEGGLIKRTIKKLILGK